MYVRIVRGQTRPGQVDELAKRWKEFFGPLTQNAPGFRRAFLAGDRATNATVGVTVWEQRPDPALLEQGTQAFRERVGDIVAGPPTIEEFEVLAEL